MTNAYEGEDGFSLRRDARRQGISWRGHTSGDADAPLRGRWCPWCGDWTTPSDSRGREHSRERVRDGGDERGNVWCPGWSNNRG